MEVTLKKEVTEFIERMICKLKVRYWDEDVLFNGSNIDGTEEIGFFRDGENMLLDIDIATGKLNCWKKGNTADVYAKVCDGCYIRIINNHDELVLGLNDQYVPSCLSIGENGYGDYAIFKIDEDGFIKGWDKEEIRELFEEED